MAKPDRKMPKVPPTYATEREGVNAVATQVVRMRHIWRETATGDIGIDGQIEEVDAAGRVTGRLVGVQVKCGASYFSNSTRAGFCYYPNKGHRAYWEGFPLPVILMLHDPAVGQTYWAEVRQQLRAGSGRGPVIIPRTQILENTARDALFRTLGADEEPYLETLDEVLQALLSTHSGSSSLPLTHFDLFVHGLTNIAHAIYYGMDLILLVAESNLGDSEFGVGLGFNEDEFLFRFVRFLARQNLARVDFSDTLLDWDSRQMHPHFIAPLTRRGRGLVELIHEHERRFVKAGVLAEGAGIHVAQEAFVHMVQMSIVRRLPRIQTFQAAMRSSASVVSDAEGDDTSKS